MGTVQSHQVHLHCGLSALSNFRTFSVLTQQPALAPSPHSRIWLLQVPQVNVLLWSLSPPPVLGLFHSGSYVSSIWPSYLPLSRLNSVLLYACATFYSSSGDSWVVSSLGYYGCCCYKQCCASIYLSFCFQFFWVCILENVYRMTTPWLMFGRSGTLLSQPRVIVLLHLDPCFLLFTKAPC